MKKETLFIAFTTQKGGVGKSAITTLTASILHYRMGYNVAVFDCDYPQWSIAKMRDRDTKTVIESERFKQLAYEQFTSITKKAYPVISSKPDEVIQKAEAFLKETPIDFDFVFFDLPGTINSAGVINSISRMHYIFSPIIADRLMLESTLAFMNVLNGVLVKGGDTGIKGIHLFWNMVDGREKSELYAHYDRIIKELDLSLMKTYLPDSKRFRKEMSAEMENRQISRSTIFPIDRRLSKSIRIEEFITEFLQIVQH